MLAIQVQYWANEEQIRHNKATETETNRHNKETETLGYRTLNETIRHNMATEELGRGQLNETIRHNKETEAQGWSYVQQGWENVRTNRMNAYSNRMQAYAAQQNANTNMQRMYNDLALGTRANEISFMNAETQQRMADIAQQNADTNWYNAVTTRERARAQTVQGFGSLMNEQTRNNIEQSRVDLEQQKFDWNKKMDVWKNINASIDTGRRVGETVSSFISGKGSKAGAEMSNIFSAFNDQPYYYDRKTGMPLQEGY